MAPTNGEWSAFESALKERAPGRSLTTSPKLNSSRSGSAFILQIEGRKAINTAPAEARLIQPGSVGPAKVLPWVRNGSVAESPGTAVSFADPTQLTI